MFKVTGSPPRVRGKALGCRSINDAIGITPACAGKRKRQSDHPSSHRDHPRVCGEKGIKTMQKVADMGSPPRVRGKGVENSGNLCLTRITPACAGKRRRMRSVSRHQEDHPRVCGEKSFSLSANQPVPGSPPRVRGKEPLHAQLCGAVGITPACAGKRQGSDQNGRRG